MGAEYRINECSEIEQSVEGTLLTSKHNNIRISSFEKITDVQEQTDSIYVYRAHLDGVNLNETVLDFKSFVNNSEGKMVLVEGS